MRALSINAPGKDQAAAADIQCKLTVGSVNDPLEAEADAVADRVMRMPEHAIIQRKCAHCEEEEGVQRKPLASFIQKKQSSQGITTITSDTVSNKIQSAKGGGSPLGSSAKSFMESRFGSDFSGVRVHTDSQAIQLSRELNAQAFTVGNDVFFNERKYAPESSEGKHLLAHELTHTVQQGANDSVVQRVVELRPPGRGEASAFERRQEIVDRLNLLSNAVTYTLDERVLQYETSGADLSSFDQQMINLIDSAAVLPMRLITGRGLVGDSVNGFSTLLIDSFQAGYVDVDDLLRSDDLSFQMNILHILVERSRARGYARRIGTAGLSAVDPATGNLTREFRRAHQAGVDAEVLFLRDVFSDASIRFVSETVSGDNLIFSFRSTEGYRIRHTFRRQSRNTSGGIVTVINAAGETVAVDDFIAQRAAPVAP